MLSEEVYKAIENGDILLEREYSHDLAAGVDFQRTDLEEISFAGCRFVECDFNGCSFRNVKFTSCDFSNCSFKNCHFFHCEAVDCKGDGADFTNSNFVITELREGSYHYANFGKTLWDNCTITKSDLEEAFFSEVKFKKMKFEEANLIRCDFFKTLLRGIDLSTCLIDGITVSDTFREVQGLKLDPLQAVTIAQMLGVKFTDY